ncbi:6172_t:CDS:10 [Dentiscutata heterogama]|uniref:6172_t:CDS:1 n=1 Tax=Dentiscutata heterogama TaxID=1316150 RepID=A0ACA9MA47_9GLOM|nr:6172_t:CDS:10 [Dentiscutata heterogama]
MAFANQKGKKNPFKDIHNILKKGLVLFVNSDKQKQKGKKNPFKDIHTLYTSNCELSKEQPSISIDFNLSDKIPLPNMHIILLLTVIVPTDNYSGSCPDYINNFKYSPSGVSDRPYGGAFLPNFDVTLKTGIPETILVIYVTDPGYNVSSQSTSINMEMINDLDYDLYLNPSRYNNPPTPFDYSLNLKNMFLLSQPKNDRVIVPLDDTNSLNKTANRTLYAEIRFFTDPSSPTKEEKEIKNKSVLNLLGIIGGIWSAMAAFYALLFGFGIISPWGLVQKSKLFKNKYKDKLLPFAADLQSEEHGTEEKLDTKERRNSSMQKRLDNLERRVQFYDNVIDISLLTSVKTDASPAIDDSNSS